jgi:hypothetical protein
MLLALLPGPAASQTALPANSYSNGNFWIGPPPATIPNVPPNSLMITNWAYFQERAVFQHPTADWTIQNSNGDLTLYPYYNYNANLTRFKPDGSMVVAGRMSIGDVSSPGTLGINNLTLAVGGKIGARAIHVVAPNVAWPDYVFGPGYQLRPLAEVAQFVQANGHLPEVPSAATVQAEGLDVGQVEAILLKKVEELTLYLIEARKENEALKARVAKLEI